MKEFWAWATLVTVGVIVADVMIHPEGVQQAGTALNKVLVTSFSSMLGSVPKAG